MFRFLIKSFGNYLLWIVFIAAALLSWLISEDASILFAICFFQTMIISWLIPEMKLYYKSRKGHCVQGVVLEVEKIKDKNEIGYSSYSATIEFTWPDENNKYQVKYIDQDEVRNDKVFTVWVNEADPSKSIVIEKFHILWWFHIIFWWLVVIGLFYLDYLRIKNIF